MAFKPGRREDGDINLDPLRTILNNSHIQTTNNPLYQFCNSLLKTLTNGVNAINTRVSATEEALTPGGEVIGEFASKNADFLTWTDESAILPFSRNVVAGTGIIFDDTVPNERTILASGIGATHYDAPLTDGDLVETDLIFAAGECIIVQVPI